MDAITKEDLKRFDNAENEFHKFLVDLKGGSDIESFCNVITDYYMKNKGRIQINFIQTVRQVDKINEIGSKNQV